VYRPSERKQSGAGSHACGRTPLVRLLATLLALCLTACASRLPDTVEIRYSPSELLNADAVFLGPGSVDHLEPVDLLEVDADMLAFLEETLGGTSTKKLAMQRLLQGLLDSGPRIRYENLKTYTALETFHAGEGNCLSFTTLFVAMAREAGLKVRFQEVKVPHNWERNGETWMYNRHVNAYVNLDTEGEYIIDFNTTPVEFNSTRRTISDREALSQYYNNMGVYWMLRDQFDLAYLHLRKAISLVDYEAYFWTNLGVLYSRAGEPERAESAWLHALEMERDLTAANNLARYYRQNGNDELATHFRDMVKSYRLRNPYYLYEMAEGAYYRGDYEKSISLLQDAIDLRDNEEQFYRLLGLNYVKTGDNENARDAIALAAKYSGTQEAGLIYSQKLRLLGVVD
jgi:Flp pilus assembly protein TadD